MRTGRSLTVFRSLLFRGWGSGPDGGSLVPVGSGLGGLFPGGVGPGGGLGSVPRGEGAGPRGSGLGGVWSGLGGSGPRGGLVQGGLCWSGTPLLTE